MNMIYIKDNTSLKNSRYDIRAKVGKKSFTLATCWDAELAKVIGKCIETYFTENAKSTNATE